MLRLLGISCVITVLIAGAVCLSPIRWDMKALGPVLPRAESEANRCGEYLRSLEKRELPDVEKTP